MSFTALETQEKSLRLLGASLNTIRHNCRVKEYPDGTRVYMVADRPIFREPGWEEADGGKRSAAVDALIDRLESIVDVGELSMYEIARIEEAEAQRERDSRERAQRRAKAAVRDLARCNDFAYFVTLTLDAERIDRYDMREITRRLNHWLDNHVRRAGLRYVLVPERHRDGAIHFHGLFSDALEAVDSGTIDTGHGKPKKPRSANQRARMLAEGGHIVYNLPAWDLGFTTAIELYGERKRAINYVCKYIGKQQIDGEAGKIGGRWYYSGGQLQRPAVTFCDIDVWDVEGAEDFLFEIPELSCRVRIIEVEKREQEKEEVRE